MAIAATVFAPLSGILTGRLGPRPPLLLAGSFITAGGICLTGIASHTTIWLLAVGYLLTGTGFGFANAPITNTAISGLPPAQAGFAGSITSTARQVGSALGIAIAGSLIASAAPAQLAQASRPGWLLVGACGLLVLLAAIPAPARQAPETTLSRSSPSAPAPGAG